MRRPLDFHLNAQRVLTCPNGQTSSKAYRPNGRSVRHCRYYAEERPLFGCYSGMVWVPDHERGSDDGQIWKDYEVG